MTFDTVGLKTDEATWVTMVAAASDRPLTLGSWVDSGKLIEDGPDGVKDKSPWPPLPVVQGRFKLGLLDDNKAERFCVTPSSFMTHAAQLLLLDPASSRAPCLRCFALLSDFSTRGCLYTLVATYS